MGYDGVVVGDVGGVSQVVGVVVEDVGGGVGGVQGSNGVSIGTSPASTSSSRSARACWSACMMRKPNRSLEDMTKDSGCASPKRLAMRSVPL